MFVLCPNRSADEDAYVLSLLKMVASIICRKIQGNGRQSFDEELHVFLVHSLKEAAPGQCGSSNNREFIRTNICMFIFERPTVAYCGDETKLQRLGIVGVWAVLGTSPLQYSSNSSSGDRGNICLRRVMHVSKIARHSASTSHILNLAIPISHYPVRYTVYW